MLHQQRRPRRIDSKGMSHSPGIQVTPSFFRMDPVPVQKSGSIENQAQRNSASGHTAGSRFYAVLRQKIEPIRTGAGQPDNMGKGTQTGQTLCNRPSNRPGRSDNNGGSTLVTMICIHVGCLRNNTLRPVLYYAE